MHALVNSVNFWVGATARDGTGVTAGTAGTFGARVTRDAMADGAQRDPEFLLAASGLRGLLQNGPFVAAFIAFAIAQIAKCFTYYYTENKWDPTRIIGSGGMPSSHTSMVLGLTTALGVINGTSSAPFAMALIFSLVVMYDASGVRLHAGKQASVLNMIICELPPDHPVSDTRPLRDTLGHTPLQVAAGAVLGVVVGYLVGISWSHPLPVPVP